MAMNGDNLGAEIQVAMDLAVAAVVDKTDTAALRAAVWKAVGNAIVTHVVTNAAVSVSTPNVTGGVDTRSGTGTVA